jgi:Lipid A 3-O-deacylase (PagL)
LSGLLKKILFIALPMFMWAGLFHLHAQVLPDMSGDKLFIQPDLYVGKLLDIHPEMTNPGISSVIDLGFNFQTYGKRDWHQDLNFPEMGIAIGYTQFGNYDTMGFSLAIVPQLMLRKKNGKPLQFEWTFGTGLAWFNNPYNRDKNPDNKVIGSRFSAVIKLGAGIHYRLSEKLALRTGLAYVHYSNGHTAVPNIGANIMSGYIGLKYYTSPKQEYIKTETLKPSRNIRFNLKAGLGFHEAEGTTEVSDGPIYLVYSISTYISKRYSRVHNAHLGLHLNYFTYYYNLIINEEYFDNNYFLNSSNIVLFIGDEMMIGRLSFVAQLGINVYQPLRKKLKDIGTIPSQFKDYYISGKVGLQYYPVYQVSDTKNKFYVGIYLKSIGGKADFAEAGIGYTF